MRKFEARTSEEAVQQAEKALNISREMMQITITQQPRRGFFGIGRRDAVIEVTVKQGGRKKPRQQSSKHRQPAPQRRHHQPAAKSAHPTARAAKGSQQPAAVDPAILAQQRAAANHRKNVARMKRAAGQCCDYLIKVLHELGIKATATPTTIRAHQLDIELSSKQPAAVIGYHGKRINALEEIASAYLDYHGVHDPHLTLDINHYRERRAKTIETLAADCVTEVIASGQAVFLDPMPARERKQLHQLLEKNPKVKTYSHGREPFRSVVVAPKD